METVRSTPNATHPAKSSKNFQFQIMTNLLEFECHPRCAAFFTRIRVVKFTMTKGTGSIAGLPLPAVMCYTGYCYDKYYYTTNQ